ncbi:MAG: FxsA family protein [Actinomycetota bacterium]
MIGLIFLLLLAVPVIELWVIVQVAGEVGVAETFLLLIGISIAGAWLLKQQGMAAWNRLQAALARGEVPTKEVTDGALIMLGGALLLTPGFVTDAVGILLLLPPTRALVKGAARPLFGRWARRRTSVYSAKVVRVERNYKSATPIEPESPSLSPPVEDDSPDS